MAERLVSFFADSRLRPTWCHLGCCDSNSKWWHPWAVQSIFFLGCAWVKRMTGGDVHTKESMSQRSCRGRMRVVGSRSSPFAFFGMYSRIVDGLVGNSCKGNLTTWKATQNLHPILRNFIHDFWARHAIFISCIISELVMLPDSGYAAINCYRLRKPAHMMLFPWEFFMPCSDLP